MTEGTQTGQLFSDSFEPGVCLTAGQIKHLIVNANQLIDERTFDDRGLDVCSYDIRIGTKAILGGSGTVQNLADKSLEIPPGSYAAAISLEKVLLPANIVARINSKRSFSYDGLILLSGSLIDPGYEGHLLFGFFNASPKKRFLRTRFAMCSLTFETLTAPVPNPKSSDPDLLRGDFPQAFLEDIADLEGESWQSLTEYIGRINELEKGLSEVRRRYDDVMTPIKQLTQEITSVNKNVDRVTNSVDSLVHQVAKLDNVSQSLMSEDTSQKTRLIKLETAIGRYGLLVYGGWGIALLVVGAVIAIVVSYFWSKFIGTPPPSGSI